jgi:hypothetical protein
MLLLLIRRQKHFSTSIAPMRSRDGLLVKVKKWGSVAAFVFNYPRKPLQRTKRMYLLGKQYTVYGKVKKERILKNVICKMRCNLIGYVSRVD